MLWISTGIVMFLVHMVEGVCYLLTSNSEIKEAAMHETFLKGNFQGIEC